MINYTISAKYAYLWDKYRPAILKLMMEATGGPQQYKLSDHEFRRVNPKEKFAFTLQVFEGGAINNIKTSAVAKDLLLVLKQSKTAMELSQASTYEFTLDRKFVLHVTKVQQTAAETPVGDATEIEQPEVVESAA